MKQYRDKEDSTLVQMSLLGDNGAFEELVTRHERAVMGSALKVTENRYSAEDASQDAFVSAWMHLSALREREKFGSWVCTIAKNHARTLQTHYRNTIPNISLNEVENLDLSDGADADLFRYEDLHERVAALSEKIRETIELHYFHDLSVKDIAKKLSVADGTVKWRLSEGRKQLRKGYGIMEKTYVENESMVVRVMRQVEALKLWRLKENKAGFEVEYRAVLALIDELPASKEKSHALADTWLMGAWWIPGQENDETYQRIKEAAEDGHNEDVMEAVAWFEADKYIRRKDKIDFMRNTQIPYFQQNGFSGALAYTWFWLGEEYRKNGQWDETFAAFREVMQAVSPEHVYYAAAKAAIYAESKALDAWKRSQDTQINICATGEVYRYIDGKLYFWEQPGFSCGRTVDIFPSLAACDGLLLDPAMRVGDTVISSDGSCKLILVSDTATCETAVGVFENCLCFECREQYDDLTACKTYICPGVGIVRQESADYGEVDVWELTRYTINGGEGAIPFAVGNRWEYRWIEPEPVTHCEQEAFYEVTSFQNGAVTVACAGFENMLGYCDTFAGKMAEVMETYWDEENDRFVDVRVPLQCAKELAVTKRQKTYAKIAEDALFRILDTDPEHNPDYTEKGRWNFFNRDGIFQRNGRVYFGGGAHFEWKDTQNLGAEGRKMLYSFFDQIVYECGMGLWSDEWVPGFCQKPTEKVKEFVVLEDETVTTPAGTFQNCRHIHFELAVGGYWGGKSDCWYAPQIGFLKFSHPIDENTTAVWQLTAYDGVGEGYFPIQDGLYRKYEPDNIGDGYHAALEYTFDTDETGTVVFRSATGTQDRANYEAAIAK